MGRPMATVSRVLQAYYREGHIADLRSGRERAKPTEEDKSIVAACVIDPFLSAREIRDELDLENVSVSTIRKMLHGASIHSRIAAQESLKRQAPQRAHEVYVCRRVEVLEEVAQCAHRRGIILHTLGPAVEGVAPIRM